MTIVHCTHKDEKGVSTPWYPVKIVDVILSEVPIKKKKVIHHVRKDVHKGLKVIYEKQNQIKGDFSKMVEKSLIPFSR